MKRFSFRTMKVGETRSGAACILSREDRSTEAGGPCLVLEIGNATGRAESMVWGATLGDSAGLERGIPVALEAEVVEGRTGRPPELVIKHVMRLPDNHPIKLEVDPRTPVPREELEREFDEMADTIIRTDARMLLDAVMRHKIDGVPLRDLYFASPAASRGLEVARMAAQLATIEPYAAQVDYDLVIVGALLHDLGATGDGHAPAAAGVTPLERLRSHESRGAELVGLAVSDSYVLEAGITGQEDVWAVQHIIESHRSDAGSPIQPRCLEAILVHIAHRGSHWLRRTLERLESSPIDSDAWVHPPGPDEGPVWHFISAVRCEGRQASPKQVVQLAPLDVFESEGQANGLLLTAAGGLDV